MGTVAVGLLSVAVGIGGTIIVQAFRAGGKEVGTQKDIQNLDRRLQELEEQFDLHIPKIGNLDTGLQLLASEVRHVNSNVDRLADIGKETHKYVRWAMGALSKQMGFEPPDAGSA